MSFFEFLFKCISATVNTNFSLWYISIFTCLCFYILFLLVSKIKKITINKNGLEADLGGEKSVFFKKRIPIVLQDNVKLQKNIWHFCGNAFYLGKGKDNRYYFIGYFGPCTPPQGFKPISVCCETIIGTDWDNTKQWDKAVEAAETLYEFSAKGAPSFQGNGARNNREWFGVYACNEDISGTFQSQP
jgi:hypothetical protein